MDPKLRPSFLDIVRDLEEILARLKVEEMEQEGVPLSVDNDKKTIPKGTGAVSDCAAVSCHFGFTGYKSHIPLFTGSRL